MLPGSLVALWLSACAPGPGVTKAADPGDAADGDSACVPELVLKASRIAGSVPLRVRFSVASTCGDTPEATVWLFGDGGSTTGAAVEHTFLASGKHVVTASMPGSPARASTTVRVSPAPCPVPGPAEVWGTVANADIVEASGLAFSTKNPGIVWTHNDSADRPRLFAMTRTGGHVGEYTVATGNRDWEDLALGWDATFGAEALYVGDIGDNPSNREFVIVLVVPEPVVDLGAAPFSLQLTEFASLTLVYPDGAHNAEALLHDPVTGDLYVVTKSYAGDTSVFRKPAPHLDDTTTTLEHVADLVFGEDPLPGSGATTGGAFGPLGDRIAIRTYTHAWMFRRDQAFSVADAFTGEPCDLGAPAEEQGEAIAFTPDGAGYATLSEGEAPPVNYRPLD